MLRPDRGIVRWGSRPRTVPQRCWLVQSPYRYWLASCKRRGPQVEEWSDTDVSSRPRPIVFTSALHQGLVSRCKVADRWTVNLKDVRIVWIRVYAVPKRFCVNLRCLILRFSVQATENITCVGQLQASHTRKNLRGYEPWHTFMWSIVSCTPKYLTSGNSCLRKDPLRAAASWRRERTMPDKFGKVYIFSELLYWSCFYHLFLWSIELTWLLGVVRSRLNWNFDVWW